MCAARGLGDNTGVVVAVTINLLVGPALFPPRSADGHHVSTELSKIPTRVQILPGRTAPMRRTWTTSQQLYLSRPAARDGDGHLPLPASPPLRLFSTAPEAFVLVSPRASPAAGCCCYFHFHCIRFRGDREEEGSPALLRVGSVLRLGLSPIFKGDGDVRSAGGKRKSRALGLPDAAVLVGIATCSRLQWPRSAARKPRPLRRQPPWLRRQSPPRPPPWQSPPRR